ncbi:MAG TPA: hypothetical protein PK490_21350 [Prosthecobacter sp.]|nr:hypothetical protein [Prosthecobacter sp.]
MNTNLIPFLFLCAAGCASCQEKSALKVTAKVLDDAGRPVEAAKVTVFVFDHWQPGEAFGKDIFKRLEAVTDIAGIVMFDSSSSRCDLTLRASKTGHYNGSSGFKGTRGPNGRWEPWNPTVPVDLKRVLNPIPLVAKNVLQGVGDYVPLPANKAAYDLEVGDWTAPYGTGKSADLVFEIQGETNSPDQNYDTTLTLSFSQQQDGLVQVERPKDRSSAMVMPYLAPESGYQPQKSWRKLRINTETIPGGYKQGKTVDGTQLDEDYFLRLRTKLDEKGGIVSAHYAKVQNSFLWGVEGLIKFQYHFNPTPNDRNLEFDPSRNLLNVLPQEKVEQP